jgi:hypothetical protein
MFRIARLSMLAAIVSLAFPVAASAAYFQLGTLHAQDDLFYHWDADTLEGVIDTSVSTPGGVFLDWDGTPYSFSGTTTWVSSYLEQDRSQGTGKAIGDFYAGGTFTLTGTLMNLSVGQIIFNGTLLSGDVPAFTLEELVNASSNQLGSLDFIYLENITGGLVTGIDKNGPLPGTELLTIVNPHIRPKWTEVMGNPGGGPLVNFYESLGAGAGSQTQLWGDYVPEPASVALVSLAGALLWPARRRKVRS